MPHGEVHFEPFLHLAGLGDDEALIAWGGFWFLGEPWAEGERSDWDPRRQDARASGARRHGIDYVVSGAAGKLRPEPPTGFEAAGTRAWASAGHFLVVDAGAERIVVHPVGGVGDDGKLELVELRDPAGASVDGPIVVR